MTSARPVRVLHVITGLNTGGCEVALQRLLASLDPAEFRHEVVALAHDGVVGRAIAAQGFPVHSLRLEKRRLWTTPFAAARALSALGRPTLVQGWMYHGNLVATLVGAARRVPVVWNVRAAFEDAHAASWATQRVVDANAALSRSPEAIVANSHAAIAVHRKRGFHGRWVYIPNGFDTERFLPDDPARAAFRRELGVPADTVLVGLVARLDPLKDQANFLAAASIVAARDPNVEFVLVGRGIRADAPVIAGCLSRATFRDRIHLLEDRSDIQRVHAALDVSVLSSSTESFPNVVGESMSCAVPCVVTSVGDAPDIVGDTGVVVEPRRPEALAAGIERLLRLSASERVALGRRARQRIQERFRLDDVAMRYAALYESAARRAVDALPSAWDPSGELR